MWRTFWKRKLSPHFLLNLLCDMVVVDYLDISLFFLFDVLDLVFNNLIRIKIGDLDILFFQIKLMIVIDQFDWIITNEINLGHLFSELFVGHQGSRFRDAYLFFFTRVSLLSFKFVFHLCILVKLKKFII